MTPETCVDCHGPATQQVLSGHGYRDGKWAPRFAWVCDRCVIERQTELNARHDEMLAGVLAEGWSE